MSELQGPEIVLGRPAIVLDNVSMVYKSTEDAPQLESKKGGIFRSARSAFGMRSSVDVHALEPTSLVFNYGEAVGIIGRNGSGKSTMLKLMTGGLQPTTGAVYASATPVLLGVNAALIPSLSGRDNVILGCLAMGMSREMIVRNYSSIVELAGLEEAINRPMASYSSGMSSRLRFAIAASVSPEILIVDEALNTGDDQFKARTLARMKELVHHAGCVFLVSHSISTVLEMCTRVIWLDMGELLMDGEPREVVKWYRKFTQALAQGDRIAAAKIKRRMVYDNPMVEIQERVSGRRRGQ